MPPSKIDQDTVEAVNADMVFRDEPRLEDMSYLADQTLAIVESMLKNTKDRSIEFVKTVLLELMMAEKQCRVARDVPSNIRICRRVLQLLYDIRDFPNLNYYLVLLCRKRGQAKATVSGIVRYAMLWIKDVEDMNHKINLIKTLSLITVGKMFLEKPRTELAFTLTRILEKEGKIAEAAEVAQSVEVETYGALSRADKVHYILQQMRLHLLNKDYMQVYITSKKITDNMLMSYEFEDAHYLYHGYLVRYYLQEGDYFEIAKAYHERMRSAILKGSDRWKKDLECAMLFLIIAPNNEEVIQYREDLLEMEEDRVPELPVVTGLFKDLMSDKMIPLPLDEKLMTVLRNHTVFQETELPGGTQRLEILDDRVIQHDIMVANRFYTHVEMGRLAELINITTEKLEEEIASMVMDETIYARMDRPAGLVKFGKKKEPDVLLSEWARNIDGFLQCTEVCSRLAKKERITRESRTRHMLLERLYY